jgi:hypothetical protein
MLAPVSLITGSQQNQIAHAASPPAPMKIVARLGGDCLRVFRYLRVIT